MVHNSFQQFTKIIGRTTFAWFCVYKYICMRARDAHNAHIFIIWAPTRIDCAPGQRLPGAWLGAMPILFIIINLGRKIHGSTITILDIWSPPLPLFLFPHPPCFSGSGEASRLVGRALRLENGTGVKNKGGGGGEKSHTGKFPDT